MHSTKPLAVYSVLDAAVDVIEMGRDSTRYQRTRDPELVKFYPDATPTKFVLRHIDSDAFNALVQSQPTEEMKFKEAFRLAIVRIEGIVSQSTGQLLPVLTPSDTRTMWGNAIPAMSDDDILHVAPSFLQEIGGVAFTRSFLPRGSAAFYQLPPSLLAAYTARLSYLAAAAIEKVRSQEVSPKSTKSAEAIPSTAKRGAKAIGATATAKAKKPKASGKKRRSRSSKR